ncbi:signal peptidase II [Olsenella sp. HMSC062G07]|uniref:signal peptidase II n=1 Tax=Olsenella sp. HMSC062G07 TaxID=1739330 RepID=UPI0008B660DD|nr:signal peptidase II [Olsenella sp. HMSC062G07]OFK24607.1 signal peptidase II [Olsenella sp. HMSC062G07]
MGHGPASVRGLRAVSFWLVIIVAVLVDQATKAAVRARVPEGAHARLIPGVVDLTRVQNTGAAFSVGEGKGLLFVAIALFTVVVCCYLVWTQELPLTLAIALGFVSGGGLGNMIDRLALGAVTDFLSLSFVSFPVFNVADVFVTLGVGCALVGWWVWDVRRARQDERG